MKTDQAERYVVVVASICMPDSLDARAITTSLLRHATDRAVLSGNARLLSSQVKDMMMMMINLQHNQWDNNNKSRETK